MAKRSWIEFSLRVPHEAVEPVAELFRHYGKGGVVIEDTAHYDPDERKPIIRGSTSLVKTYMPISPEFHTNRELIHIGVKLIAHIYAMPPLKEKKIFEADWESAWKRHFTLLKVGRHIVIRAPWQVHKPKAHEVIAVLEPGLAFGTGHHPTTRRCLEALENLIRPGDQVLDVGSGSGVLSIVAAKLGAGKVQGLELDPVALRTCRANLQANGVSGLVRCYKGTLPHPRIPKHSSDLILANINSVALESLAPHLKDALKDGGWLVGAGILQERQKEVESAFQAASFQIHERFFDDDWVALLMH